MRTRKDTKQSFSILVNTHPPVQSLHDKTLSAK